MEFGVSNNIYFVTVDGIWSLWSPWGGCSKTCGLGQRRRDRECSRPLYGGKLCIGTVTEIIPCEERNCAGNVTSFAGRNYFPEHRKISQNCESFHTGKNGLNKKVGNYTKDMYKCA